ncbi:uncharacterized protein LOC110715875 [Chenopodium quinoa]|uniref:uncharacterized protein LOC110715875 n=1 Tax=Chenopodium quinoa TaxID=63459 RepID=UPI000B77FCE8|nr:uncharacterized protein LOC110715875 [Chenopodium quinoa]
MQQVLCIFPLRHPAGVESDLEVKERGWWSDSRDEDRAAHRSAPSNPKVREEKARAQVDHPASSTGGTGRWEHRAHDRRPLERNEHDRGYVKERSFSNRGRVENTGFPPRGRFNGADDNGKFRGRENFGGRQGYRSSGSQAEKWKHDLYDEANRSPPPKKEEDPVAKVEALLSL